MTFATAAVSAQLQSNAKGGGEFTAKYGYAEQETTYYDDGRETELLNHIFKLPSPHLESLRNNPALILQEIDKFGTKRYLMNIGELKGRIVTSVIATHKPRTCIEVGGYVGYSTLLFGAEVAKHGGPNATYYCIEHNPVFAAVIMALVELAGLRETVRVLIGESTYWIRKLKEEGVVERLDFLFLDHLKPLYTRDLKVAESLGLVTEGTVMVADNMVKPGNPEYHRWVNASCEEKRKIVGETKGKGEAANVVDGLEGVPELRYKSEWVESWEPQGVRDAIEITRVLGKD